MRGETEEIAVDEATLATWWTLTRLHARISDALDKALQRRYGVSLSEFNALRALAAADDGTLRMQALADAVALNQSSVSRLVARLERLELCERCICEKDRRGVFCRITQAGRDLVTEATPYFRKTLALELDRAAVEPDTRELVRLLGHRP